MKNSKLALVAAALAASLGGTPAAMADANHAAAYRAPRRHYDSQQRRHLTKCGPGRAGHKSKIKARGDRKYAYIAGKRRNLHKLIGGN